MGHIPVPWFIGGLANHSAEVARLLAYNATGGRQGIIGNSDCRVLSLPTPGPAVRVMPGAYNIKVQSQKYGMYLGMLDSEDVVNTTPTGSSSGRSDLVVMRVENPTIAGEPWDLPNDPESGPYVRTVIIEGVPSNTTTFGQLGLLDSAIAVARIDFPPSTATVTQSMIKDLRDQEDNPSTPPAAASQLFSRFTNGPNVYANSADAAANLLASNQYAYKNWPPQINYTVAVPEWATSCDFEVAAGNVAVAPTPQVAGVYTVTGDMRISLGSVTSVGSVFDMNVLAGGAYGGGIVVSASTGGSLTIPAAVRGTTVALKSESRMDAAHPPSSGMQIGRGSYIKLWLHFKSSPTL